MRSFAVSFSLLALVIAALAAPAAVHVKELCRHAISGKNIDCSAIVPRGEDWDKHHGGQYDDGDHPRDPYNNSDDDGNVDGDGVDGEYYEGGEWKDDNGDYYEGGEWRNGHGGMGHGGIRHPVHHDKDWGLESDSFEHGWGDIPGLSPSNNPSQGPGFSDPSQAGNPTQFPPQPSNPTQGPSGPNFPQPNSPTQGAGSNPNPPSASSFPALNEGDLLDLTAALDALPTMVPGQDGAPARLPLIGIL